MSSAGGGLEPTAETTEKARRAPQVSRGVITDSRPRTWMCTAETSEEARRYPSRSASVGWMRSARRTGTMHASVHTATIPIT